MSDDPRLNAEKLVEIHRARSEWEGNVVIEHLRHHGIEATLESRISGAMAGADAGFADPDNTTRVCVMEHNRARAAEVVRAFLEAVADERALEDAAAKKLHLDKETIHRLRGELREERRTFNYLGWLFVIFLGASALLWAIWPAWLKTAPPDPAIRGVMVIMLALGAVFAGNWAGKQMR